MFFKLKEHLGVKGKDIKNRPDESAAYTYYYNDDLIKSSGGGISGICF